MACFAQVTFGCSVRVKMTSMLAQPSQKLASTAKVLRKLQFVCPPFVVCVGKTLHSGAPPRLRGVSEARS